MCADYLIVVFCIQSHSTHHWLEKQPHFACDALALKKINSALNSSLHRCWLLALVPRYLGGRRGWLLWLHTMIKFARLKKKFRCGFRADKFSCIIFRATRVQGHFFFQIYSQSFKPPSKNLSFCLIGIRSTTRPADRFKTAI